MSNQSQISRLETAKQDLRIAIQAKGVTVPAADLIDTYAGYVDQISAKDNSMIDAFVSGTDNTLSSDTVTSIAAYRFYAFGASAPVGYKLEHVDFPNVETINQYAFDGCSILEAVFPKCTALVGNNVFRGAAITRASFPAMVNAPGNYAFRACTSLTDVDFPQLETGGQYMFQQCNALLEADFSNLRSIGYQMFLGATNFAKLTLRRTDQVCYTTSAAFNQTPFASGGGALYVPTSMVDAYKASPNWSWMVDRIFAIP